MSEPAYACGLPSCPLLPQGWETARSDDSADILQPKHPKP